jgi:hypothetical protein
MIQILQNYKTDKIYFFFREIDNYFFKYNFKKLIIIKKIGHKLKEDKIFFKV